MVVEITGGDREQLLGLNISHLSLSRIAAVDDAITLSSLRNNPNINAEAVRIANLVYNRVEASGILQQRMAPERSAPSDLVLRVGLLLAKNPLVCSLCSGLMHIRPANRLLQPSPDRIESSNGDYGPNNFQIVHLACNLAKNRFTVAEFQEWLTLASAGVAPEQCDSGHDD